MDTIAEPGLDDAGHGSLEEYVGLILEVMQSRCIGLRWVATRAGLHKSRLGRILHTDLAKRAPMSLIELRAILRALDIDMMQAIIWAETITDQRLRRSPRYSALVSMLCKMFYKLPANLIAALEEIDAMDGSEIRPEWASALQRAVIRRITHEVEAIISRRAALGDFTLF